MYHPTTQETFQGIEKLGNPIHFLVQTAPTVVAHPIDPIEYLYLIALTHSRCTQGPHSQIKIGKKQAGNGVQNHLIAVQDQV